MSLYLFHRIWSSTLLCAGVALAVYAARNVAPVILSRGLLAVDGLYLTHVFVSAIVAEHKINSLGKHAPSAQSWSPFNLSQLFSTLWYLAHHRSHEWWWELFQTRGNPHRPYTVETLLIGQRLVLTADEDNIKAILAKQFSDYGKGEQFRRDWMDFLGLSIFSTDGDLWHNARSLLRPQFIKDRVSDLHTFENHIQALLPLLAGSHNGATVCVYDLFHRFTLDAATDFLLGNSVDSLHNGHSEFATAFSEIQRVQSIIARSGVANSLVPRKSFYKALKVLNEFVDMYIDRTLQLPPEELEKNGKGDEGYTFLHALAGYTRDRRVLRDQLVAVLLAGRDTTADTLSWLFYELSKHPEVVHKLRQEIIRHVGLQDCPTYEHIKNMRYLQHTLNETLRLYPVVPYNVRIALKDTTLPRGGGPHGDEPIGILKDTPIGYSTFVMQRRPDIYPPPSAEFPYYLDFVPDRWDHWTPKAWTYIPFNGGPRICLGQQFALTEMAYTVVRILQTFERIESRMDEFPMLKAEIVLSPALGVKAAFFRGEKA